MAAATAIARAKARMVQPVGRDTTGRERANTQDSDREKTSASSKNYTVELN